MTISHVPVLGPLDYDERCLEEETVTRGLNTHRASMHFRNYWFYNKDNFEAFADLLKQTWPGMTISPPEIFRGTNATLFMMCNEHKLAREIFWAGFGFQVWCQLLTHMCRSHDADLLIADEPEIYLHPDLQRQLIHHLRELGPDIVIATHSSEIVNEAEPRDILLIQKDKRTAQRIKNPHKVQQAFDLLGSSLNVTLTQLARNRRIVFVEGTDFTVLRRFARRVGKIDLANGTGITFLPLGGFTGWPRLKAMAWAFQEALGEKIRFGAVFDRDFRCDEEINKIKSEIGEGFDFVHFHSSKEIENYLLLPSALDRAISATIRDRVKRNHKAPSEVRGAIQILNDVSEEFHDTTQGQYVARRHDFLKTTGKDLATIAAETSKWFAERWRVVDSRMEVIPGKACLAAFCKKVQDESGISLQPSRIVEAIPPTEIPDDLQVLILLLEKLRTASPAEEQVDKTTAQDWHGRAEKIRT